jgi:hypothetical protein
MVPMAPVLVALCIYVAWGYSYGRPYDAAGDPAAFIHPGTSFGATVRMLPHDVVVFPGTGFDGQFTFYIGLDPLLPHARQGNIDYPAYRYQRILLPALGWLTSFGDPDALKWSLPLINLFAILLSGFLLAVFSSERGRSVWWSLAYLMGFGLAIGFVTDVPDPLATGLLLSGAIQWLRGRTIASVVLLSLSVLARETGLAAVILIAAVELVRTGRRGLPWLAPAAIGLGWQLLVALRFPVDQFQATEKPRGTPFVGAFEKLDRVLHSDIVAAANWEATTVVLLLVASVLIVVLGADVVRRTVAFERWRVRWRGTDLAAVGVLPGLAYGVLVILLTSPLWRDPLSYPRYGAPIAGFLLIDYAVRRRRVSAAIATALAAITFANPLFGLAPTSFGPVLASPGAGPAGGSTQGPGPVAPGGSTQGVPDVISPAGQPGSP